MKDRHLQIVLRHTLKTLPDSLKARFDVLNCVRMLSPRDSEERTHANLLLEQLKEHERTQMFFQFEPPPNVSTEAK